MAKKRGSANASKALSLEVLQGHFHQPINDVARELGVCVTVLKQRCREFGIVRWPFRKVRKLDNIIQALEGGAPAPLDASVAAPSGSGGGGASASSGAQASERLATAKQTRELLLQNPNSTAHLQMGKLKSVRKRGAAAEGAGADGGDSGAARPERPVRARRPPQPHASPQRPQPTHALAQHGLPPMAMLPAGVSDPAALEDAQRAMMAYAAYSSASAYSNAAALYMVSGGTVGLPRGASGVGLDGSGPIRPIATSGSFCGAGGAAVTAAAAAAAAAAPASGGAELLAAAGLADPFDAPGSARGDSADGDAAVALAAAPAPATQQQQPPPQPMPMMFPMGHPMGSGMPHVPMSMAHVPMGMFYAPMMAAQGMGMAPLGFFPGLPGGPGGPAGQSMMAWPPQMPPR